MNEIISGVTYKEYLLTVIRMVKFLDFLGEDHKKNTTLERMVLYDFFLKFPKFSDIRESSDFDTKFSYFHWKPNYKLYKAALIDAFARQLIIINPDNKRYFVTEKGSEFVTNMENKYLKELAESSKYVEKNICKLSNKAINEKINIGLLNNRGILF